jgi:BirA family biotin operon repressor/biotin-[acetyl-CoA-carboxylase] ligase
MSNKWKIASILEQTPGEVVSGEALARELGVSRTAVWKHMKSLVEDGYPIAVVPNKGYFLEEPTDTLSAEQITKRRVGHTFSRIVHVYQIVESTNEVAKDWAKEGAPHGTLVVADEQSRGKGRRGKSFHSPKGKGIYMSLLLRPDVKPEEALHLTIQAVVAVTNVLEAWFPTEMLDQIKIKWVNDVFIGDRKVAGILTEAAMEMESGMLDYVIVGIGINVAGQVQELPEAIQHSAGFLSQFHPELPARNQLIADIVNRFEEILTDEPFSQTILKYKEKSYLTGKPVQWLQDGRILKGTAVDIDQQGGLVVTLDDGSQVVIHSGEVELLKNEP